MKRFGVREVANIVFKAKANGTKIGDKVFKAGEPVIYFDTAKTSSLEGSAEAVYARGGRGNPKLVTWEGEKEMTFTFEDALISPVGLSILLGAGLGESTEVFRHIKVRAIGQKDGENVVLNIGDDLDAEGENLKLIDPTAGTTPQEKAANLFVYTTNESGIEIGTEMTVGSVTDNVIAATGLVEGTYYIVDGYVKAQGTTLTIAPDKFSDAFYIEAETLFRSEGDNKDHAAQIIIPSGKVQSNFEISMANSGDPSTFSFTIDAMADYTMFNKSKKVLCEITILD